MKRVNKFLIIFIIVFGLILFGIWRVIQSPLFASAVTNYLNEKVVNESDTQFNMGNLTIEAFPPMTRFENVEFKKDGVVTGQFQQVSLIFSPWDFFKSNLRIDQIEFQNGFLNIEPVKKSNSKKIDIYDLLQNDVVKKLPFKFGSVAILNSDILVNEEIYDIKEINLRAYNNSIEILADINELKVEAMSIDNVRGEVELVPNNIWFKDVNLTKNTSLVNITGKYQGSKKNSLDFKVKYKGSLSDFIPAEIIKEHEISAFCNCEFIISGDEGNPNVDIDAKLSNVRTIYADADELLAKGTFREGMVTISNGTIKVNGGEGVLQSKISIDVNKPLDFTAIINSKKLHSHNFLKILGSDFNVLRTRASGKVNLRISEDEINVWSNDNVVLNDLKIGLTDDFLNIKNIRLDSFRFDVKDNVLMRVNGFINGSNLNVEGVVTDKNITINGIGKSLNLDDLGALLGEAVSGKGDIILSIDSSLDDVEISASSSNLKKLKIIDYELLENSKVDVSYNFNKSLLNIRNVRSSNVGILRGHGTVDFDKEKIDISINSSKALFEGLNYRLKPIWNEVGLYLTPLAGEVNGSFKIHGSFENIVVKGKVKSKKFSIFNESFDQIAADFIISGSDINISSLSLAKDKSKINFKMLYDFHYGIKSSSINIYEYKVSSSDFYRKLDLGYDGIINSNVQVSNKNDQLNVDGQVSLLRSYVGRKKVKPSNLIFKYKNNHLSSAGVLLGGKGRFESDIYLGKRKKKLSSFNMNLNLNDLRTIFGIISLHNIYDQDLQGEIAGNLKSTFTLNSLRDLNIDAVINKFRVKKLNKFIKINNDGILKIKKGKIEDIILKISGNGGKYNLSGSGDLLTRAKLEQDFSLDFTFLHILSSAFERLSGTLGGRGVLSGNVDNIKNFHEFSGKDIFVKAKKVPLLLSNASFSSTLDNNEYRLTSLKGKLGDGVFLAKGEVKFKLPLPVVDMNFDFDEVNYPFGNKSNINLGGSLKLKGKSFPYDYSGSVIINNGRIEDEFNDLGSSSGFVKSVDKYIGFEEKGLPDFVTLNIQAKTRDSIRIKNRLSDILVVGDLNVIGNPLAPGYEGQLNVIPELSKFKFKGNEFFISKGLVNFSSQDTSSPVILNFSSEAKVGQYDIQMDVTGGVEDLNVNLESNPALSKEDIFSLLTLGITTDYSKNLEDKDRASLTTIGLGTLLVDQLEINEGLNSSLGLKLSVLPEVSDSSDTPIEASGTNQVSKVKTATKLKVQKKITNKVDVTFSNTFGSDEGQKQEINIDLNINESFSIQGVFEKEEDDNNTDTDNSDSVGADLKWRFSF